MKPDEERAAYVALALTPGIGAKRLAALLEHCQTATGALSAPFAFLCTVPGITRAAATALSGSSAPQGARALAVVKEMGGHCVLPEDPAWPPALKNIPDPPTLLFALGELSLLERPAVAVVGSRDHSFYGAEVCREMVGRIAGAGVAVVSGMARGLDAVAHSAALDAGGATIGVLGNGLGVIYPAANRRLYERVAEEGLLVTEFPPGDRPGIGAFPRRNRLISGLARVTVVIEAASGSGTLITVGTALAQGRDVMAIPGNITSPTSVGTNRLIRDGAEPLLEVEDLLAHYPEAHLGDESTRRHVGSAQTAPPDDLGPLERSLFVALGNGPAPLDVVIVDSGAPAAEALVALSALELRGLVEHVEGKVQLAT
jgi:DNA processing protein